jgi:D-serine deaminase-like pyridoxal phosphate-dependent protein
VAETLAFENSPMDPIYKIHDTSAIYSPALVFYKDLIRRNLATVIDLVGGDVQRLRPHVKTHKTRELIALETEAGITKQKVATLAEAEMAAGCGVNDVFLAYNLIGPNCRRMARLAKKFPQVRFSVTADDAAAVEALSRAMAAEAASVDVWLDMDVGQHRTGIAAGPAAAVLYEKIAKSPGLRAIGLHVYDGHNHQERFEDRKAAAMAGLKPVLELRQALEKKGVSVPRLCLGGTPTFPVYARLDLPGMECSPGTCFLHDDGYGKKFPDLAGFVPAALVLSRVISRPTPTRFTLDLGYKAIASDPPAGKRCLLLDVPDYEPVLQNEEHFVIETPAAERFPVGTEVYAVPTHICPTSAMHKAAYVVEGGNLTGMWEIVARDRVLTV